MMQGQGKVRRSRSRLDSSCQGAAVLGEELIELNSWCASHSLPIAHTHCEAFAHVSQQAAVQRVGGASWRCNEAQESGRFDRVLRTSAIVQAVREDRGSKSMVACRKEQPVERSIGGCHTKPGVPVVGNAFASTLLCIAIGRACACGRRSPWSPAASRSPFCLGALSPRRSRYRQQQPLARRPATRALSRCGAWTSTCGL